MTRRWTTWLALGLWLLMWVLIACTVLMKVLGWHGANNTSDPGLVTLFVALVAFATMGALVAAHVPSNPLGWIFLAIALGAAASGAAENYAYHGLVVAPDSLPLALPVAWYYSWGWYPTVVLVGMVPLLYPTGHVPGRRWRPVLWALIVLLVVTTVSFMCYPGPLDGDRKLPDNPFGVGFLGGGAKSALGALTGIVAALLFVAVALSVIVRYVRSSGDERQQMKWMVFAAAFLVCALVVPSLVGWGGSDVLFSIGVVQLPVAVGVAMFKYRLYDVDRLINRTLVYAVLTVVLGAAYLGLVLAGQAVSSSLAGGSNLAIAVSTLVVAALFLPVRRRIQHFVDHRFYRRRYDARRTLEGFGARLREQVELETLSSDLALVVQETIQPSHVSLWLRSGQ